MRSFFMICLLALGVATAGCGSTTTAQVVPSLPHAMPVDSPGSSYMLAANAYAGDALNAMLVLRMSSAGGILTTSFVNIHDFEQTSAFGRVVSQQIGSRLGQHGFRVLEARLASSLNMVPRTGEFMLTRETARLLADTYDAGAVLVGCYSDEGGSVYVSARVVRLSDNAIMAAYEYVLPRDGDIGGLLAGGYRNGLGGDSFWERSSNRTPAFPGGVRNVSAYTPPARNTGKVNTGKTNTGKAAPGTSAPGKTAPGSSAAQPKAAAPSRGGTAAPATAQSGPAVPRYVDPAAKAAATPSAASKTAGARKVDPVAKAPTVPNVAPAGPAPAVVAPSAPVPGALEKDAPSPASIPGGA